MDSKQISSDSHSRSFSDQVLNLIFDHLLRSESDSLTQENRLLNLRLVCKRWSSMILSSYFQTLQIHHPSQLESRLNNWREICSNPPFTSSPVQCLKIGSIYHRMNLESCRFLGPLSPKTTIFGDGSNPELHLGYLLRIRHKFRYRQAYYPSVCTIYGVIELMNLLGENLKSLHLTFSDGFGFPKALIGSIGHLSFLRSLSISHTPDPAFAGETDSGQAYEPDTLISLLASLPQLESLSLGCGKGLPNFTDSNLTLPNLIQLKLIHQTHTSDLNVLSLGRLIQHQIQVFEFTSLALSDSPTYFPNLITLFQDQLIKLRIDSQHSIQDLHLLISHLEFPKLKFYDPCAPHTISDWSNLEKLTHSLSNLLQSEIVQELETLVIGPYSDFLINPSLSFAFHLISLFKRWGFVKKKSGRLSREFRFGEDGPCRIPRDLQTIIFHQVHALGHPSMDFITDQFTQIGIKCVFLNRIQLEHFLSF